MPEPQWLTDQEQRTWRALVKIIQTVDFQLERQLQRDAQITRTTPNGRPSRTRVAKNSAARNSAVVRWA